MDPYQKEKFAETHSPDLVPLSPHVTTEIAK